MSREYSRLFAALLVLGGAPVAAAQTCQQDTDCPSGTLCAYDGGSAGGDTAVSPPPSTQPCTPNDCPTPLPPDPTPVTGSCQALPIGLCVEQADCSPGLTCVVGTIGTGCVEPAPAPVDGGVAPATTKQNDCTPSSEPAPYGYCSLPETPCTSDAECLPGLKCVDSVSIGGGPVTGGGTEPGIPADAGVAPMPRAQLASSCQVAFTDCTSDANSCEANYECVEEAVACSGSSGGGSTGVGSGSADAGTATTEPTPAPAPVPTPPGQTQRDPACQYASSCYPKYMACNSDADCLGLGWTCFDFAGANIEAFASWPAGAAKACLPKGLALAAEASRGLAAGGGKAGNASDTGGAPVAAPEGAGAGGNAPVALKGDGKGNGCAVGFGPRAEGSVWLLLALGLVARRRRQNA